MPQNSFAIVCPIPNTPTEEFLASLPAGARMLVVDDSDGNLQLPKAGFELFDYDHQRRELKKFYPGFRMFQHSAACRNFGHFLAYRRGYEHIIALDYDCRTPVGYFSDMFDALSKAPKTRVRAKNGEWINPLFSKAWYSRGFPYEYRTPSYSWQMRRGTASKPPVLHMGMWSNVVDINAIDKVLEKPPAVFEVPHPRMVAEGMIPLCGMNNAFIRDIIPAYFFLPNFPVGDRIVSRHDDIWGGHILQRLAKKRGDTISFGKPFVYHERESHQPRVLYYEHLMHILNPLFYSLVDEAAERVRSGSYKDMFADFTVQFQKCLTGRKKHIPAEYFSGLSFLANSMRWWADLFKPY